MKIEHVSDILTTSTSDAIFKGEAMIASYKKLWKLLIDRDMMKRELCEQAHISPTTLAKLGKGENVGMDILLRICTVLNCDISDIVEAVPDAREVKE